MALFPYPSRFHSGQRLRAHVAELTETDAQRPVDETADAEPPRRPVEPRNLKPDVRPAQVVEEHRAPVRVRGRAPLGLVPMTDDEQRHLNPPSGKVYETSQDAESSRSTQPLGLDGGARMLVGSGKPREGIRDVTTRLHRARVDRNAGGATAGRVRSSRGRDLHVA